MSTSNEQILAALAEKFLAGTATDAEKEQLHRLYDDWLDDQQLVSSGTGHAEALGQEMLQAIRDRIGQKDAVIPRIGQLRDRIPFYRMRIWRQAAAACVIFLAGGLLLYFNQAQSKHNPMVTAGRIDRARPSSVEPGRNRAILTLADGNVIDLDSSGTGLLAQQGSTRILRKDGKIIYDPRSAGGVAMVYNSVRTPRGGQYQLVLPDRTKVWLNAASSVKFPVAFTGTNRVVEVSGEVYFEVAKDATRPFIARVNDVEVKVLGTHFDIMAYGEEEKIATTLLEGSVLVSGGGQTNKLTPGQQAVWKNNGSFDMKDDVDMDEVIAWKDGKFHFNNADIKTIMRQVARWYDVDIEYKDIEPETRMGGVVSRKEDIRQLLNYFEIAGKIRFTVDGRKIIVSQS